MIRGRATDGVLSEAEDVRNQITIAPASRRLAIVFFFCFRTGEGYQRGCELVHLLCTQCVPQLGREGM